MSKPLTILLCISLAAPVLSAPAVTLAGPAQAEGARVRIVVDALALGGAGAFFEHEVDARVRAALEQAGYQLVDDVGADATVRVRLSFFNEADLDYLIDVDISAGPEIVHLETLECPQCVDDVLLAQVDGQQPMLVAALGRALAASAAAPPEPASEGDGDGDKDVELEADRIGHLGVLGGVGIGVAALGMGTMIAGGAELGRGKVYDDPSRAPGDRTFVDHRPPGPVMVGIGGAALIAGVAMLVTDVVIRSKRRRRANAHSGRPHPLLGPGMVGLGYTRQF